ncbi:MAG: TIGR03364 family FAD-dependent oxidoreductase [Bryobacteraceae bacterium]|nr:TIGR03364 family FAD-dependent oxidoreductase [Bryobacteraceae bacterium]
MRLRADVAVVGGGIVGLAQAYAAAKRGRSVVLFERHAQAQGASIRNFGMIWPIGQPPGERLELALASRTLWQEVLPAAGIVAGDTGSWHLAYHADEANLLREFAAIGPAQGYSCQWVAAAEVLARSPGVRPEGLLGGLWSTTELIVDPRVVARQLPAWLAERFGVTLRYGSTVRAIELPRVETSSETWEVDQAIVCGGDDFVSLYPELFATSELFRCKLQMLRTAAQPGGWKMGAALAAGLSLRFYTSFAICASLAPLQRRIAEELPEYDRYGIHVMASQMPSGEVTLGDSHEYGEEISIFDKPEIDDLILRYLDGFLRLPAPAIAERWHGVYAKHPSRPFFSGTPAPGVRVVTGLGGAGMTLSFGVAQRSQEN